MDRDFFVSVNFVFGIIKPVFTNGVRRFAVTANNNKYGREQ